MTAELPWFPFYPADWLLSPSVRRMSYEARGAYVELLCYQWREGSLPVSAGDCAALTGVPVNLIEQCLEHFPLANAKARANARLSKVRSEQKSKRSKRVAAGRRGAQARWQSHSEGSAEPMPTEQSRTEQNRGGTSSSEGIRNATAYVCCGRKLTAVEYVQHLDERHEGREPA